MQHRSVLVFLKQPTPGRVKTRLAVALGDEGAAEVYRRLVARVLENLASADFDELRVMFDPPGAESGIREWLREMLPSAESGTAITFVAQSSGDLGDRLAAGFEQAFSDGADAVAAIGTDCVAIDADTFARCWRSLQDGADAVFGPSEDGGYYLVATNSYQPTLFEKIPWSSEHTMARTLQRAEAGGLKAVQLQTLSDVDTVADWNVARVEHFSESPQ